MGRKTALKIPEGVGVEGLVKQREKALSGLLKQTLELPTVRNWEESSSKGTQCHVHLDMWDATPSGGANHPFKGVT